MTLDDRIAVRLHGADKVFPNGLRALQPVDLTVAEGEFVTLLGPSGCGKSTLLRLVAGLSEPSSGVVEVAARFWVPASAGTTSSPSFRRTPESSRPRTAFVFQQPTLMPWASVARNVRLPLDLEGIRDEGRVEDALRLVGLSEFAAAYPRELSGGMQMRTSIARALVTEPSLLLMDEPFGALDEITRNRLDRDVRELWSRRRLTVLFVTHSIYEAVFLSTRVVVMSPRPGSVAGELRIDPGQPRDDAFRLSTRFAAWCNALSALLDAASRKREEA